MKSQNIESSDSPQESKTPLDMYWNTMFQLKGQSIYLDERLRKLERWNNGLTIGLLVASSGSLSGWTGIWSYLKQIGIFPELPEQFLSNTFTIISQIATVTYFAFNFPKRLKAVSALRNEIDDLFLQSRADWFQVLMGTLNDSEIYERLTIIEAQKNKVTNQYFSDSSVPLNKRLSKKANEKATIFFRNHF